MNKPSTKNPDFSLDEIPDLLEWHAQFMARHGRPLRVLHVGNIAANGYLNAKFLRRVGIDADIVSRDYYHVMAFPEWEDLEITHDYGDDLNPVFSPKDLEDYKRPDWYFNGPLAVCADNIERRYRSTQPKDPQIEVQPANVWHRLAEAGSQQVRTLFGQRAGNFLALLMLRPNELVHKLISKTLGRPYLPPVKTKRSTSSSHDHTNEVWDFHAIAKQTVADFQRAFPDRQDQLTADEVFAYVSAAPEFAKMFAPYDIVQCYATEPLNALLAGKQPYTAFEHGTLRHFTLEDDPLSRMTALGYRRAAHSFITNGDCLSYAQRIGLENYSPIIHPIDVEQHRQDFGDEIEKLRQEIGGEVILFCPVRHDYEIKGTDKIVQAIPLIKKRLKRPVKIILVNWGADLQTSIDFLQQHDCANDVIWAKPMSRVTMIKYIRAADVVLDQMVLPPFGSTAPQSLAAKTPVISSYVPESTAWMFPEPAPIMSAFSKEELCDQVELALDKEWRADFEKRATHWIDHYHHPNNVIRSLLTTYKTILSGANNDK